MALSPFVIACLIAVLGGLTFGFDSAVIAPFLDTVDDEGGKYDVSSLIQGVITSSLLVGSALGSTIGGGLADRLGRKKTIQISSLICVAGSIGSALCFDVWFLCLARGVNGLGIGIIVMVCPTYIGEISDQSRRGALISTFQLSVTAGIVIAYLTGLIFKDVTYSWRWMIGLGVVFGIGLLLFSLRIPESPIWLLSRGRKEEARPLLEYMGLQSLLDVVEDSSHLPSQQQEATWSELLQEKEKMIFTLILAVAQQLTGINAIIYFAPTIFDEAGLPSLGATLGVGCWNMVTTIIATYLVDSWGRRPLMLGGLSIMAVSSAIAAVGFIFDGTTKAVLVILGIFLFIFGFEVGPGPLYYVVVAELFPSHIRGKATAVANFEMWIANLIVGMGFLSMCDVFGEPAVFFGFAIIAGVCVTYLFFALPETKGISFNDVPKKNLSESQSTNHEEKPIVHSPLHHRGQKDESLIDPITHEPNTKAYEYSEFSS